jgi:hypothetical protein
MWHLTITQALVEHHVVASESSVTTTPVLEKQGQQCMTREHHIPICLHPKLP